MKPVRMGVLGVSDHFIKRCLVPLKALETVELYGIASRSQEKADEAVKKLGIQKGYGSYQALIDDKSIEMVYIPLPNHLHMEWIKKAADAGKHIVCEKPLAMSTGEVEEAAAYAQKKGVLLMEAFMYRFHPQWKRAREIIATGELGSVVSINSFFSYDLRDPLNIRNIPEAGGGAIPDIGCYAVSSARFLAGAEPKRVVALLGFDPVFKTDVLSSAILDFGGPRAVFTVSTQCYPAQYVEAHCTGGELRVELPFNAYPDVPSVVTVRTGIGERKVALAPVDQYACEFEEFALAVRSGSPSPLPIADAVANQRVLDALYASAKSGGWANIG
jgi:predicted dehydrogenase